MPDPAILAFMPESADTYSLDRNLQTVQQFGSDVSNAYAVTHCPARDGNVWVLFDDLTVPGRSILRKFNPSTGDQIGDDVYPSALGNVPLPDGVTNPYVQCGDYDAFKSLMDVGCGELLTVDRNTRQLIKVRVEKVLDNLSPQKLVDGDFQEIGFVALGAVTKRYSKTVAFFDGAVNSAADRLWYILNGTVNLFDLENGVDIRTIYPPS